MKEISKEQHRPTVRKRRRAIAVLVPAALLGVAATGYAVLGPDEVLAAGIGCYSSATELDSNVTVVATTGGDPVKVCKDLWAKGDVAGSSPTPDMTACVNGAGAVAVFPTQEEDVCARLGLQPLPQGYREAARHFARMSDDVYRQLYEAGTADGVDESEVCLDEKTSLRIVEDVLEKHGFTSWGAEIRRGDYGDRTCMNGVAFDDRNETVLIIPSEPGMIPWHQDPTM